MSVAATATALVGAALLHAPAASAAPADDARVDQARAEHDAVAGEIAAIAARVTEAEENLERMSIEAEAASGNALAAQFALETATQVAQEAVLALEAADRAVDEAQDDVAELGRQAYMGGGQSSFGDLTMFLDAEGPGELLHQAATLDRLGVDRARTLGVMEDAQVQQASAEREAQETVVERDRAAGAAAEAHAAAEAQLEGAQARFDTVALEKLALGEQLRAAEIRLLEMEGARDAARAWEAQQAAKEAAAAEARRVSLIAAAAPAPAPAAPGAAAEPPPAASRGASAPQAARALAAPTATAALANGRVSSCYGSRWGTLHAGVDIAAPIGTPIHVPEGGVVLQAGPASGFGLAVAIQHSDKTITLYGHVNQFFVTPGQVVTAGQRIAEVGNRGQSTGPHLHFEVHTGGLYANRINPTPWLAARGISLGGC